MNYVQYFTIGAISGKLVETCGDRGVVILDGRNSLSTMHHDAIRFNGLNRPIFNAYQLFKGASFLDAKPISEIINLNT